MNWGKNIAALTILLGCGWTSEQVQAQKAPRAEEAARTQALPAFLSATDRSRLENFESNRESAVMDANTDPDEPVVENLEKERKTLDTVLIGRPQKITEDDILGAWRCRMLKLGGRPPLTVYGFFQCNIHKDGDKIVFEKVTGSQPTKGALMATGADRFLYAGASKGAYGDEEKENEVGYLFKAGPKRLRLEFPQPHYESQFNIMELVR